jgi:hypothetical protein
VGTKIGSVTIRPKPANQSFELIYPIAVTFRRR